MNCGLENVNGFYSESFTPIQTGFKVFDNLNITQHSYSITPNVHCVTACPFLMITPKQGTYTAKIQGAQIELDFKDERFPEFNFEGYFNCLTNELKTHNKTFIKEKF